MASTLTTAPTKPRSRGAAVAPSLDRTGHDLGERLQQVITALVAGGNGSPDIEAVATTMGTSVRTLQRRLRDTGLTYSEICQRTRCAAAQRLLKNQRTRIGEIARVLGYSDPAHFTRAFQRWTGVSPRSFRAR